MSVILLADARAYIEVGSTAQDGIIQALIDGAEELVERRCGIRLASAAREEYLDGGNAFLQPKFRPVTTLTRVTDTQGDVEQDAALVGDNICRADSDGKPLLPSPGLEVPNYPDNPRAYFWPEGRQRYKVEYLGGFVTVPAGLKIVLLKMIRRNYMNRDGVSSDGSVGKNTTYISDMEFFKMLQPYDVTQKVFVG